MGKQEKVLALLAASAALVLAGAGCGKSQSPAAPAATPEKPVVPAALVPLSPCDHPYYPLIPGYSIDYSTVSNGQETGYTFVVDSVGADSANISFKFGAPVNAAVSQELGCRAGTLYAKTYLDMGSVLGGVDIKTETKSVTGDIMPADLKPGVTWTTRYETTIIPGPTFPAKIGNMTSTVDSVDTVIGEETVTVPAGTFTAMKIEEKSTTSVIIPGMPTMTPQVGTSYQWWVKGVGLVKSTTGSATVGEGVVEATAIHKP